MKAIVFPLCLLAMLAGCKTTGTTTATTAAPTTAQTVPSDATATPGINFETGTDRQARFKRAGAPAGTGTMKFVIEGGERKVGIPNRGAGYVFARASVNPGRITWTRQGRPGWLALGTDGIWRGEGRTSTDVRYTIELLGDN